MQAPADRIIEFFGGVKPIADGLNINPSTVHRWTYSRERGGTGGYVPPKYHSGLAKLAKSMDRALPPEIFVPVLEAAE